MGGSTCIDNTNDSIAFNNNKQHSNLYMKKIKLVILSLMFATNVQAGETFVNEMMCDKTDTIFQALKKEYGEIPVVMGKADDVANSTMSIWTNPTTNSWTIVASKDELSCIIGAGRNLRIVPYSKKSNT